MPIKEEVNTNTKESLNDKVNAIIQRRQESRDEFEKYFEKTQSFYELVNSVKSFEKKHGWSIMLGENKRLKEGWERLISEVNRLENLLKQLSCGDRGCLIECLKRVKREYLNVGCIGPWRQGKSTVISKLTNLSDYVIPRSKFFTCTGTTINVFNGNQVVWENNKYVGKGGNKAVIYFHSFNSICEIINDYLQQFGFVEMPYSDNEADFVNNCSNWYTRYGNEPVQDTELKKMLDKYLEHAEDYADYLKSHDGEYEEIINLDKIETQKSLRKYVSYYEKPDDEYETNVPPQIFVVLAVKKVDIFTHFCVNGPNGQEEVGKLQFVDTPGIGERRLGVEETLADALKSDLDIAICLRKVSDQHGINVRDSIDFHKVLKQNTFKRKPENWVFYLYNIEGKVPQGILDATYKAVREDLVDGGLQGLDGKNIPGINLSEQHIRFVDVQNDAKQLHEFFLLILNEMANTICDSDTSFYTETRDLYKSASDLYDQIIRGSMKTISQCLPTFDDREKILRTIKTVNDMWIANVRCPETLNENISKALAGFYEEPYGFVLAEALGLSQEKIEQMRREINNLGGTNHDQLAKREEIVFNAIFPLIQNKIPQFLINVAAVNNLFGDISENLCTRMIDKAVRMVKDSSVIQEVDNLKVNIWKGLMNEGFLKFGKADVNNWLDYFLELLKDGGSDFASLYNAIVSFKNYKFDIGGDISNFVKATIRETRRSFIIVNGEGDTLEDIQKAVYTALFNFEKETKVAVQSECRKAVNGQVSFALKNFNDQIVQFVMTIIPLRKNILDYDCVFEELIKFYNKYSSEIFLDDEKADQKSAVKEWNDLRLKYVN